MEEYWSSQTAEIRPSLDLKYGGLEVGRPRCRQRAAARRPLLLASLWRLPLRESKETADEAFKVYITRKTQGCLPRWGCPRPSEAAATPGPGATPGGAGNAQGLRRQCVPRHRQRRTTRMLRNSSRAGGGQRSGAIANLELGDVATRGPGVGHTPSKTSRLQRTPLIGQARLCRMVYSH